MKNILWTIFEVLINVFQGYIFCYYSYQYLGNKKIKPFLFGYGSFYSLLLAGTITLFNHIMYFEHLWAFMYVLIIFIFSVHRLKGSIIEKCFSAIIPIIIMCVSSSVVSNIMSVLLGTPLDQMISEKNVQRIIMVISVQLMIIYLSAFSLKILKNNGYNRLNLREWILIISIFAISIIISAFLNFIALTTASSINHIYIVISFLGILLVNIIVIYIVNDLSKMNNLKYENELLRIKEDYTRQYISDSNTEYEVISKLRHDFKSNWSAVYDLVSENKNKEALSFIKEYLSELSGKETLINTSNDIVNAVVNVKLSAAKSYGINVICMCVADFNGISDLDLCSLISNMLENAVTACKSSNSLSKRIYVNISSDEFKYEFCVKNTIKDSILNNNPKLNTTKTDKNSHGLGVKIIKSIAEKYSGTVDFYEENDEFCCYVVLKREISPN